MGLSTACVESAEAHYGGFVCKVCLELVEAPAATPCSHVFCRSCIGEWRRRRGAEGQAACPACNTPLPNAELPALKDAQPLAWRVLSRVQVRCPLSGATGCGWRGDYGELASHLAASDTHRGGQAGAAGDGAPGGDPRTEAEALKEAGNAHFQQREYHQAVALYSKAIATCPELAAPYANRAAAWLAAGAPREAAADARAALDRDPGYAKAHVRLGKALVALGDLDAAASSLRHAIGLLPDGDSKELQQEADRVERLGGLLSRGKESLAGGDPATALLGFMEALSLAPDGLPTISVWAARAEAMLGRCDAALRRTLGVLRTDSRNVEAHSVRGWVLVLAGELEQATKHLREALRLDPDFSEAQRTLRQARQTQKAVDAARAALHQRCFGDAVASYSEALAALSGGVPAGAPLPVSLLAERANCFLRLKDTDRCIADCARVLELEADNKSAHLTRAQALHMLNRHKDALLTIEALLRHNPDTQDSVIRGAYERARFEVRKESRPDYYAILGVGRAASNMEIKQAYKTAAFQCHPDKFASFGEAEQKQAEERFKLLQEALGILGEDMSKSLYDDGYDKEAIEERVQRAQRAAREGHGHGHHGHH